MIRTAGIVGLGLFVLFLTSATSVALAGTEVTTFEEPDVNRVYCGKQVPYAVCRCAFQGQGCEVMKITQERAKGEVETKFRDWVGNQIESVAKSCIDGGGHWNTATRQCITCTEGDVYYKNKCVPPEKAGEDAEPAMCVSMLEFSKDWKSFTDFANGASVTDTSDEVRLYHEEQVRLSEILGERQRTLFDTALVSYLSSSVEKYLGALAANETATTAVAYTELARDMKQLPERVSGSVQDLFDAEDLDAASTSLGLAEAVVSEEYLFTELVVAPVRDAVKEQAWDAEYETMSAIGGAAKTALATVGDFAPLGEVVPEFSEDDMAALSTQHVENLKGDKVTALLAARTAQLRLDEIRLSVEAVTAYNKMEQHKSDEFTRAREAMINACEN